jgi:hypothetical protein
MIVSTLVAAALASTQPAPAAASAPMAHDHAAMAAQHAGHDMTKQDAAKAGKMDCCKDGCACCADKGAAKAPAKS